MQIILERPLAFFDLETTGLSLSNDKIVEIAIVKLMPNGDRVERRKLINPEMPIPQEATAIHGITDDMVKDAPAFKQLAKGILEFLEGCDLGGYNCNRFDIPMLVEEFLRAGYDVDFENRHFVDAQHIFYKMEPRTLGAAVKYYCNSTLENAHSALADTNATIDVFLAQIDRYKEDIGTNVKSVLEFIGQDKIVDYAQRFAYNDKGVEVFNFGKHKGKAVIDVLKNEPGYYDWMQNGDFALHTKKKLKDIYVNYKLKNKF